MTKRVVRGDGPPPVADRPACPYCNRKLRPYMRTIEYGASRRPYSPDAPNVVEWSHDYHAHGGFCTLNCAVQFAKAAHRAGYKMKGPR